MEVNKLCSSLSSFHHNLHLSLAAAAVVSNGPDRPATPASVSIDVVWEQPVHIFVWKFCASTVISFFFSLQIFVFFVVVGETRHFIRLPSHKPLPDFIQQKEKKLNLFFGQTFTRLIHLRSFVCLSDSSRFWWFWWFKFHHHHRRRRHVHKPPKSHRLLSNKHLVRRHASVPTVAAVDHLIWPLVCGYSDFVNFFSRRSLIKYTHARARTCTILGTKSRPNRPPPQDTLTYILKYRSRRWKFCK